MKLFVWYKIIFKYNRAEVIIVKFESAIFQ